MSRALESDESPLQSTASPAASGTASDATTATATASGDNECAPASVDQSPATPTASIATGAENDAAGSAQPVIDTGSSGVEVDCTPPDAARIRILKALFFLSGVSASTWARFGVIYYTQKGLTPTQIGQLEGSLPLVMLISQPLWGYVADLTRSKKLVSLATTFISTAILMLLAFPQVASSFQPVLLISCAMSAFTAPGILDAYALDVLGERHKNQYGSIRLWGAASWGFGALLMGIVNDTYVQLSTMFNHAVSVFRGVLCICPSRRTVSQCLYIRFSTTRFGFDANFIVYATMAIVTIVLFSTCIPSQTEAEKKTAAEDVRTRDLVRALCRPSVLAFYAECAVLGGGMAVVERLLFIYLIRDLNGSVTLAGGTVACTVLLELPIFYYADWLLRKAGHHVLICVAMLAYVTRVFGYTVLTPETVYYILPLECLHGVTFASFWISAVDHSKMIAPPAFVATFQMILSVVLICVGGSVGSFVGGWAIDVYGARAMYRFAASAVAALLCIRILGVAIARRWSDDGGTGRDTDLHDSGEVDGHGDVRRPFLDDSDYVQLRNVSVSHDHEPAQNGISV